MHLKGCALGALLLVTAPIVHAQASTVDPANEQKKHDAAKDDSGRTPGSWEMPEILVTDKRSNLREEDRIGGYAQPRWTAHRRFPTTRIYVRPEGVFDVEFWSRTKVSHDGNTEELTQIEFEMGLPHRFQLDFYLISTKEQHDGAANLDKAVEVRYAFADWGVIPFNPTAYLEWISQDARPDKFEAKLLLGDELAPSWHWGTNFVVEQEDGGARETELEVTGAISKTLVDEVFSIGAEGKFSWTNANGSRHDWENDFRIGPSIQYRPLPRAHIDVAPLFGITNESKRADIYVVVGWEF